MASGSDDRRDDMKIEKLNGANYQTWKYNVSLILMEKGLWSFVTGREPAPKATDKETVKKNYCSNSEKAYALISLSVEKPLQIHIVDTTDPREAWEILKNQFSFVSITQVVRLTRRFYQASMKEGDDLMQHLTQMTTYAQQLRDLDEEISPQKFGTVVLSTLPPSYEHFITSLNARKIDELNWDSIKNSLTEEYLKRKDEVGQQQRNDALITRASNGNNNSHQQQQRNHGRSGGPKCYDCGDNQHQKLSYRGVFETKRRSRSAATK